MAPLGLGLAVGAVALGPGGCTYDFDAAFSEAGGSSPSGGGGTATTSSSGGTGGEQPTGGGGSGASAAAGGSGGTGGDGGSGGVGGENCSNGVDDDGNLLVDCADPLCTDYACVAAAPADWLGPVAVYLGASAPPACGSRWPTVLTGGRGNFTAPMAQCSACGCDDPDGASCGLGSVEFYQDTGCADLMQTVTPTAADQCYPFSVGADDSSIGLDIPIDGGSCAATGGVATLPPVSWAEQARICAGASLGVGCDNAAVCAPIPAAAFAAGICIYRTGNASCPAGPYTNRTLVYTGVSDTRDCTSCDCGNPTGMVCSGTSTIYAEPGCVGGTTVQEHNGTTCEPHGTSRSLIFHVTSGPDGGQCAPWGGVPTGFAQQSGQVTVCCQP